MIEREELFERFWDCLQANETPPEYLGKEPEDLRPFDPYQMVGEWIALRHEVKQQGKLLQSTQSALQKAMEAAQTDKEQLQNLLAETQQQASARYSEGLAAQKSKFEREQEGWLRDLLGVLDALDHACTHWQDQSLKGINSGSPTEIIPQTGRNWLNYWFARLRAWLVFQRQESNSSHTEQESSLAGILESNREGVELIRRMLLEVLRQRQVVPIEAQGQLFDPTCMYAVARQESDETAENTVLQEVVRGYRWGGRTLREAQVIVAVKSKSAFTTQQHADDP